MIVLVIGAAIVVQGLTRDFEKDLRMNDLHGPARTLLVGLGAVGTVALGVVFATAGGLVIDAAVTYQPHKSRGLDGALRSLAQRPYGPWLLGSVALGLVAFGLYGLAAAEWAKT